MKNLANLPELWQTYFVQAPKHGGADAWTIVFMARDGQGLFMSLANPFAEAYEEVFVQLVSDEDLRVFARHYKQHLHETLETRFGLFRPDVDHVLTEYPDWPTFHNAWLQDDARLVQSNMPLLFDYPDEQEYRAMQLKGADYAGYRRLLVVLYQYRKQKFQRIFIQNVDDAAYKHIYGQLSQLYERLLPQLIFPEATTHVA